MLAAAVAAAAAALAAALLGGHVEVAPAAAPPAATGGGEPDPGARGGGGPSSSPRPEEDSPGTEYPDRPDAAGEDAPEPPRTAADASGGGAAADGGGVQRASGHPDAGGGRYALATVHRVVDGDTIADSDTRYRLSLVNAPEAGQRGYAEAKSFVAAACGAGSVFAFDQDAGQPRDKYGRIVAKVWCGSAAVDAVRSGTDPGPSINEILLDGGLACIYAGFIQRSEFGSEDWVDRRLAC